MTPDVTIGIVIPVYNSAEFLTQTLDSVRAQTWQDWIAIITDDVSTDESVAIAQSFARIDPRIRVITHDVNVGAHGNFNRGITAAARLHCEFVVVLPADDWWQPDFLQRTAEILLQDPSLTFVHANVYRATSPTHHLGTISALCTSLPPEGVHTSVEELFTNNYVAVPGTLMRYSAISKLLHNEDIFLPTLRFAADYHLWLRLLTRGARAYYIAEPLGFFRKHDAQHTHMRNIIARVENEVQIFGEYLHDIPEEYISLRQQAYKNRVVRLAFAHLEHGIPNTAHPLLAELRIQPEYRHRLDIHFAYAIVRSPAPAAWKRFAWKLCRWAYQNWTGAL